MPETPRLRCIVADLRLARIALAEAQAACAEVELWSPADGAVRYGVGYWAALDRAIAQETDPEQVTVVLNCADAAGFVLAAFQEGLQHIHFTGPDDAAAKLEAIGRARDAVLHPGPPPSLDLRDRLDPAASCRAALRESSMPDGAAQRRDAKTAR